LSIGGLQRAVLLDEKGEIDEVRSWEYGRKAVY
jgi:hypothetical protein